MGTSSSGGPGDAARRAHRLPANHVPVYYAGGENIDRFRGGSSGQAGPEDWVASTSALPEAILPADAPRDAGISRLPDGTPLPDAIAADPVGWLGPELAARFGGQTALLVKLLDAAERLPVHCHPSRPFAAQHLAAPFGKTEGWIVMDEAPGGDVWLGFSAAVTVERLRGWIEAQSIEEMLTAMNRFSAGPGDVFYVPAGVPHAIGPGVMVTELQEPTSFSILAEHVAFGLDEGQATLGLGWETALGSFDRSAYGPDRWERLRPRGAITLEARGGRVRRLFGSEADPFFGALRIEAQGTVALPRSFLVLVVETGAGELDVHGQREALAAGQTWVVPYAAGPAQLSGDCRVLACLPPGE